MPPTLRRIIFIVGPTAAGKTAVAVDLARKIRAEIISCDSMQIYKGMDIITSKPSLALAKRIPHHLIDIISPTREYDVFRYRREALKRIALLHKNGKIPLFVGGTGLYVSALVDGIFSVKAHDVAVRRRLYKEAEKFGSAHLYSRLKDADPAAAEKIHPNDTKRIVRALEVFEVTGKRISGLQQLRKGLSQEYDIRIFCLLPERETLYRRIEERVDRMFAQGLAQEVKRLLRLNLSKTARYAIGIRELKEYFEGTIDLARAKELIKRNTRRYAKRQLTWFRKDKRIAWVRVGVRESPEAVANRIVRLWNG